MFANIIEVIKDIYGLYFVRTLRKQVRLFLTENKAHDFLKNNQSTSFIYNFVNKKIEIPNIQPL